MSKQEIMTKVSRGFHKAGFQLKKHSPEILLVAGIVGSVVTTVMACKATLKVNEIVDEAKENIDKIHVATETGKTEAGKDYTVEDSKKELAIVYAQTGLKFVKLYGPAISVGAFSIGCLLASNNIIHKRNIALSAAYATVDKSFKDYRTRLIDRFGEELDHELKYNIQPKEVEEVVVNEDGSETVVKKTVNSTDLKESMFARCFDETCLGWTDNAETNLFTLHQVQNYANEKLQKRGYLFLNEVYEMLGFQTTQAGQVVGWIYDEDNTVGDNCVDFGIYDLHNERKRAFVNGYEKSIWVDFNVDGNIMEYLSI